MQTSKQAPSAGDETCKAALLVPELVHRQATATPDALAVKAGSEFLSYSEVDRRSNQVANYLRSLGVPLGSAVGVCLDRSTKFPVAALGILKAGCAYLPLERKTPVLRLKVMIESAHVPVVLTNEDMAAELKGEGRKVISLGPREGQGEREISKCSTDAPAIPISGAQLAYVIFTSGSTGTPKAVAVSHGNLLNLCRWHNRAFGITPADRATQFSSIGFDAAVWELWPHLTSGASVHLVDEETRTHPEQLRDWIVREKVTISFVPTPLAAQMMNLKWPKDAALRFLLTGADTLRQHPPGGLPFALVNNYGPTECTVVATSGTVLPHASRQAPSIGKAIDNMEIHILDDNMHPVAAGAIGEIYIGGAGVAQGYLNDAQLSAQRFVSDPFTRKPEAKLYRTGDLGSFLANGEMAFHGRADDQVKIRGYRIEINEIASAIRKHPAVKETVVVAGDNRNGEKQLVAYVVPRSSCPAVSELRDFLGKLLPDYMLPATFVALDALPLAPSGKVDRSALPAPSEENLLRDEIPQHPSTPTEERIAAIVASLLGLNRVGVNDNFFYLGGNSLFGTQVIARLRDAFDVEVPLLKLFDHPTVADLAAEVERMMVARLDAMTEEEAQRLLALNPEQANV